MVSGSWSMAQGRPAPAPGSPPRGEGGGMGGEAAALGRAPAGPPLSHEPSTIDNRLIN